MSALAEEDVGRSAGRIWARRGGGLLMFVAAAVGIVLLAQQLAHPTTAPRRQMARITIVPNTPPPPPPPREEKMPEPREIPKRVEAEQPKPVPQPDEQIKMEGQGSDSGLAGITAGSVTNDYAGQKIGGDGSGRFDRYKVVVQQVVQMQLQKDAKLRSRNYRVLVKFWLRPDGSIARYELSDTTGDSAVDGRLRAALAQLPAFGERPPEGLPQPITVRLTTRS